MIPIGEIKKLRHEEMKPLASESQSSSVIKLVLKPRRLAPGSVVWSTICCCKWADGSAWGSR